MVQVSAGPSIGAVSTLAVAAGSRALLRLRAADPRAAQTPHNALHVDEEDQAIRRS